MRRVEAYGGTPRGLDGQPLAWLHPHEMDPTAFPAADRPIINALRLPPLLLITGADPGQRDLFLARIDRALGAASVWCNCAPTGSTTAAYPGQ